MKRRISSPTPPIQMARLTPPFRANAKRISVAILAPRPRVAGSYHLRAALAAGHNRFVSITQERPDVRTTAVLALPQHRRAVHDAGVPIAAGGAARTACGRDARPPAVRRGAPRDAGARPVVADVVPARRLRRQEAEADRAAEQAAGRGEADRAPNA